MRSPRALILVHDPAPERRARIPGALLPALDSRGVAYDVGSFVESDHPEPQLDIARYTMLIVMGSHESAYDSTVPWLNVEFDFIASAVVKDIPVLGICFGSQLLARVLGGSVTSSPRPEQGFTSISSDDLELIPEGPWMQLHQDAFTVPDSAWEIARNENAPQAFTDGTHLGVQFHPEVTVDSFESWIERWISSGSIERFRAKGFDINRIREQIASREQTTSRACDQLLGTFYTRTHLTTPAER